VRYFPVDVAMRLKYVVHTKTKDSTAVLHLAPDKQLHLKLRILAQKVVRTVVQPDDTNSRAQLSEKRIGIVKSRLAT
jgi:hypothetical protein